MPRAGLCVLCTCALHLLQACDMIAPTDAGQRKKAGVTPNRKRGCALCSSNTLTVCIGNITPVKPDRKSTRLNSSHLGISYAVFCLKKQPIPGCTPQLPLPQSHPRSHADATSPR